MCPLARVPEEVQQKLCCGLMWRAAVMSSGVVSVKQAARLTLAPPPVLALCPICPGTRAVLPSIPTPLSPPTCARLRCALLSCAVLA